MSGASNMLQLQAKQPTGVTMFEIVEIGHAGWFTKIVKIKALCDMEGEKKFSENSGIYKTLSNYRGKFTAGEILSIKMPNKELISVGDQLGLSALLARNYLDRHLNYVGTTPR